MISQEEFTVIHTLKAMTRKRRPTNRCGSFYGKKKGDAGSAGPHRFFVIPNPNEIGTVIGHWEPLRGNSHGLTSRKYSIYFLDWYYSGFQLKRG